MKFSDLSQWFKKSFQKPFIIDRLKKTNLTKSLESLYSNCCHINPRLILVDNAILNFTGHFYEYDQAVVSKISKKVFTTIVLGNLDFDREMKLDFYLPYFRTHFSGKCIYQSIPYKNKYLTEKQEQQRFQINYPKDILSCILSAEENVLKNLYKEDLLDLLIQAKLVRQDILFFPNISFHELVAMQEILEHCDLKDLPVLKIILRRSTDERTICNGTLHPYALLFKQLQSNRWSKNLEFFVDTHELKKEYESLSAFEFKVTPIPFRHILIQRKSSKFLKQKKKRITFLGSARAEKGFQHIPKAVEFLRDEINRGEVEFILQLIPSPELTIIEAVSKLKEIKKGIQFIEHSLTLNEYYNLLSQSHIILNNYDPNRYHSRSSCIFIESLISGTPVVVTQGSWMAQVMPAGCGEAILRQDKLGEALRKILKNYPTYASVAQIESIQWAKIHNVQEFNRIVIEKPKHFNCSESVRFR